MISPIESLASALKLSDDPRVVTTGTAPHQIVHTNKGASPTLFLTTRSVCPPFPSALTVSQPHTLSSIALRSVE